MGKNKNKIVDSAILNSSTFLDYAYRFKKIAVSLYEWENLPSSMDARFIEECLYMYGCCAFLYDDNMGFINTKATSSGYINIYGLPTSINCNSYGYNEMREVYSGLYSENNNKAIFVMNNFDRIPTISTIDLFCMRLAEAERTIDVNVKAQKTPVLLVTDDRQQLTAINTYNQYQGNAPVILGEKDLINQNTIKSINTEAPYVVDKLTDYKKEIWNEALTYLGISNIDVTKKERLTSDEASRNNEVINLNLQNGLKMRKLACKQFNENFKDLLNGKEINVKVNSDINNLIKTYESTVSSLESGDVTRG